jgi:hypothetical protein
MKQINATLGIFIFLIVLATATKAQVTTATLVGQINDVSGEALIGAAITALHEPSGVLYGTTTRIDGSFTLPNLRVGGPYTIEASYVGYKNSRVENVNLSLAQKLWLTFDMEEAPLEAGEVVITARQSDVLNNERTGAATIISNELLQSLPTISRSASDYYRLTPSSDGNSFGGRNDQFNNFSLDGSIFNNPFGLDAATPGGQADAQPISLDAIEQIQVSLAPYDVTQSGFTGAGINAVTKSGTNDFHGTVFGFYRNQDFTGSKVDGTEINVPDLSQTQLGFSLGGPIIKNKLFFFINAEIERKEDAGANVIASRPGAKGGNISRVLAADLEMVSQLLDAKYGYKTGPYENYILDTESNKGIVKLDWNISNNHKLTASYNFLDAFKQKPAHPSAIGRRGPDLTTLQFQNSGYQINNKISSGIVELNSIFGNQFSNKLQVGYTAFRDDRDPASSPFPVVNISKDGIRYIVAGHEPFSIHNVLDQDVFQISDNFNIYLPKHTVTVGTSLERFDFNNSFNLGAYGGLVFAPDVDINAFADSVNAGYYDAGVAAAAALDVNDDSQWALAETNVGQWAFYVQDEWDLQDNFKLTLGLRMDLPLYFDTDKKIQENIDRNCCYDPTITYYDEAGNPVLFDHTKLPDQTPLFSPRLGFNWDVKSDNTLQVRGGTGLFTGRLPFVWIGNQVANPNFFFYNITAPDFKFPQVWRSNLGADKAFENGWILTTDLIYTKDVNGMMVRNYGLKPPTARLGGVDNRLVYDSATDRALVFGAPTNAYVFTNTDVGSSFNATVSMQKRWSNGLYASLAYNFLDSKDASSIEAEISSDAYDRNPAIGHVNNAVLSPSLYGNKHRVVGVASKKFSYSNDKLATTLSIFAEYAQGGRFSYTYSGDINGDGSGLNDLIYIPTDSEIDQMNFSGGTGEQSAQRTALKSFIAQDDYLSSNRGSYMEKYGILNQWYSNWDLRILQDFKFGNNNTIQVSIDVLNIGNLLSNKWGVRTLPVNTQPIGVSVDADQNPTYSFETGLQNTYTNDFGLNSRWQMQFGLRYIF